MTQDQAIDSVVAAFERDLRPIVEAARRAVIERLTRLLSLTDGGIIARTMTNARLLRSVRNLFEQEMRKAGYSELVDRYVASMNGQFAFFDEHIEELGKQIGQDLAVKFGARDKAFFSAQQISTIHVLEAVVENVAQDAQRQAVLSVGGLKLADLISAIAEQFDKSIPEARTLADTALASFYRLISDRGYKIIEKDLPSMEIRYRYEGPDDKLTRPFCDDLMKADRSYVRAEIDAMRNGQIPNVFVSGGGFNCRHSFRLKLDKES